MTTNTSKTTVYVATLSNGKVERIRSKVADYVCGIEAINWTGELHLVGLSRTMGDAMKTVAKLGVELKGVAVVAIGRE